MARFHVATREQSKLRLALDGPSGSGKTYSALRFATRLAQHISEKFKRPARIAVIDSENGSAKKYVGESPDGVPFAFDVSELRNYAPTEYTAAINDAGREGFDILVVDSLSHAWSGEGGALEIVGSASFTDKEGWRKVTPMHNRLVESMLKSPCHVIGTLRSQTEYVLEKDENGKNVPKKIGTKPIQRQGMEYEFDVFGDMDLAHILTITKSRCSAVADLQIPKPGANLMDVIYAWLTSGVPVDLPADAVKREFLSEKARGEVMELAGRAGIAADKLLAGVEAKYGVKRLDDLTPEQGANLVHQIQEGIDKKKRVEELRAKKAAASQAALDKLHIPPATNDPRPSVNGESVNRDHAALTELAEAMGQEKP